jgi:tetratricopeptide (TPR) repeat protein
VSGEGPPEITEVLARLGGRREARAEVTNLQNDIAQESAVDLVNKGLSIYAAANFGFGIKYDREGNRNLLTTIKNCFQQAVELDPQFAEAHYCLGVMHLKCEGEVLKPTDPPVNLASGEFKEAVRLDPSFDVAWYSLGQLYLRYGKTDEAIDAITKTDMYDLLGDALRLTGRVQEAVIAYCLFSKNEPRWYNSAMRYPWLAAAYGTFSRAYRVKEVGDHLSHLCHFDEAIFCFEKAIRMEPRFASAWEHKGVSLSRLGRFDEAIVCFDKALNIDQEQTSAWYNKGFVFLILGDFKEAIRCFDRAFDHPDYASFWNNYENLLGSFDEVIDGLDKALDTDQEQTSAWYNKGFVFLILGGFKEAVHCFDRSVEADPDNPRAWLGKAFAEETLGRKQDAARSLKHFIVLAPAQSYAKEIELASERLRKLAGR